ncbi:hypothetical protein DUNSADRAFT_9528, partial [Dunaliella salina]
MLSSASILFTETYLLGPRLCSSQAAWSPLLRPGASWRPASEQESQHHGVHNRHLHTRCHHQQWQHPEPPSHQAPPSQSPAAIPTPHHLWDQKHGCIQHQHQPQQHVPRTSHSFPSFASSHALRRPSPQPATPQQALLRSFISQFSQSYWPSLALHAHGHQRGYAVVPKQEEETPSTLPGLVEELQRQQVIRSPEVAAVLLYVDRALFLRIGFGEETFKAVYK